MSEEKKEGFFQSDVWDYLKTIVITVAVVLFVTHFIWCPVQVSGSSMDPTLSGGQRAFTSLISARFGRIDRFDIVTLYWEENDEMLVKRVIGLPGETVEVRDEVLYINGEAVEQDFFDETFVKKQMAANGFFTRNFGPVVLAEDEYFVMGDNRVVSTDSRAIGPFKKKEIKSVGIFVFWPLNQAGTR